MERLEQMSIFDVFLENKIIKKPVRLISFFSGIEAQYKALSFLSKELNIPIYSYKTCEWAYNSIVACNYIHFRDFTNYSENKTKEELITALKGISVNYNEPLSNIKLQRKPLKWLQTAYNCCVANHNLINVTNVKGVDLKIDDNNKYEYILTYSFPCQDLSLAGKKKGMNKDTRSGLLWEVERILNECKKEGYKHMPTILLMENVPQIHEKRNYPNFEKWMLSLEQLGYTNYYKDLNAKDFGVPQTRNRTFMISILRKPNGEEYNYKFPISFERKYNLKDLLENQVDKKYYLSSKMIDYLIGINQKESKYNRYEVFKRNLNPNKKIAATITTLCGQRPCDNFIYFSNFEQNLFTKENNGYSFRIRKLTPKEAMRLMAFQDKDVEHMYNAGLKDSAIFHCAGDSICVNVLIGIFAKLFGKTNAETERLIKKYIEEIKNGR